MKTEFDVKTIIKQLWETNLLPPQNFMSEITFEVFQQVLDIYILTKCAKKPKRVAYFFELVTEAIENDKEIIINGIKYLAEFIDVKNKIVRRNVMVILGILIEKINFESDSHGNLIVPGFSGIDDEIQEIIRRIAERFFDIDKTVRTCAIQILSNFKNFFVNRKTTVKRILKDILRHDPSEDVRNCVMKFLVNENCVVEKINDESLMIRQNFYRICLPNMKLSDFTPAQRALILEKSLSEREFAALPFLKSKIYEEYHFPEDLAKFVRDFFVIESVEYDATTAKQIEENRKSLILLLNEFFRELSIDMSFFKPEFYEELNVHTALLLHAYLSHSEVVLGREALELVDFEYFSKILYSKVKDISLGNQTTTDLYFMIILFQLTVFYDICDPLTSKQVLSTVYKFLKLPVFRNTDIMNKFIESSVILASGMEKNSFFNFFGSLIATNKTKTEFLYTLCKYIMMRVTPLESTHYAIIDEIAIPGLSVLKDRPILLEIIFYFIVSKYREDPDSLQPQDSEELNSKNPFQLFNLILADEGSTDIHILSDLFLLLENYRIEIADKILTFYKLIQDEILEMIFIIPFSKCLLVDPIKFSEFFDRLVFTYFKTTEERSQQYLTIFLQQFTLRNPGMAISKLFRIVRNLETLPNKKIFIDQTLIWIKSIDSTTRQCYSQDILLNSMVFFISSAKSQMKKRNENFSENKKKKNQIVFQEHVAIFEFIVARIQVNGTFSVSKIKQMIYCLGLIAKIGHKLNENIGLGELSNCLMIFNDNTPISDEDRDEIENRLKEFQE